MLQPAERGISIADPVVGVLALQGDVREHLVALAGLGVTARPVRRPSEFEELDGIVIPGGESTAVCRLLDVFELREPLARNDSPMGSPPSAPAPG